MGDDWRQDILNDQDFMKAQGEAQEKEKAELWGKYIRSLLLPENEEELRKFLMQYASEVEARGSELAGLGTEEWINDQVSRLRKNKKDREEFIRDWCG